MKAVSEWHLPATSAPEPVIPGSGDGKSGVHPGVHPLATFEAGVLKIFRMDLQLHFFWSFALTLCGVFWTPMLAAGLLITVLKEAFDWLALKGWSWGDFCFGIAGSLMALVFLYLLDGEIVDPRNGGWSLAFAYLAG